jgi:hypothetical protein
MSLGADRVGAVLVSDTGPGRIPTVEAHPIEATATGFPIIDGEPEGEGVEEKAGWLTPLR